VKPLRMFFVIFFEILRWREYVDFIADGS
jgi:hypothetical protein